MGPFPALKRCEDALAPSQGPRKIILGNPKVPIDVIPTMRYIWLVLSEEGPLLEAVLQWTERELAGPGPRNGRRPGGQVERREAQRLPWARAVPCRARWVRYSRLKGARWCPGASRRSIPSLGFARDWQTSDASRRENAEAWLFESVDQKFTTRRHEFSVVPANGSGYCRPDDRLRRGPITPGVACCKRHLTQCRNDTKRRMGPRLRGDDAVFVARLPATKSPGHRPGLFET
jgi:hypothetical protein